LNKVLTALLFSVSIPFLVSSQEAFAANILFVGDNINDVINVPAALTAQGHTVNVVANDFNAGSNPTLAGGGIFQFDAIYWGASGDGFGSIHTDAATFTNLNNYVNNVGGCVFVTGYDSIVSPTDPNLIAFLGGAGGVDIPPDPLAIVNIDNALTTGVRDIRTLTPIGGSPDMDNLLENLDADTTGVTPGAVQGQWAWTLKEPVGTDGKIAYVSNGRFFTDVRDGVAGEEDNWLITANDGTGVYNAALLNFALACEGVAVGGEFLPIDSTALLLAGFQTSAIWMLPALAGIAGAGAYFVRARMNRE